MFLKTLFKVILLKKEPQWEDYLQDWHELMNENENMLRNEQSNGMKCGRFRTNNKKPEM